MDGVIWLRRIHANQVLLLGVQALPLHSRAFLKPFFVTYFIGYFHLLAACILIPFDPRTSLSVLVSCSFAGTGLLSLRCLFQHDRLLEGNHCHLPGHAECPTLGGLLSLCSRLQLESGNSNHGISKFDFDAKVRQSLFVELGVDENRTLSREVFDQLVHGKNSSTEVKFEITRVFSINLSLQTSRIIENFLMR